ncbi:MAG: Mrp/NBP35 family ATP-binding protein, partial [Myxococcota bacterium]
QFQETARAAVLALDGVSEVSVHMTAQTRGTSHQGKPEGLEHVQNVVAVASGKGGVGKSTVAVNLALALAESGAAVGLLDCDIYGPSIPIMLGIRGRPHITPDKKIMPLESCGLQLMSIGFLAGEDAPVIWRGPMVHGIIKQFLGDVRWGELDYLVLDLPPGTGDAALTLTQSAPLAGAVIVTTPQEVSLIDARKGLQMFQRVNVPVLGIVENMSYFVCDGCDKRHALFGQGGAARTARELGTQLLVQIPLEPAVVAAGDSGKPTLMAAPDSGVAAAIRELAGLVARKLSLLNSDAPPLLDTNIQWVNTP